MTNGKRDPTAAGHVMLKACNCLAKLEKITHAVTVRDMKARTGPDTVNYCDAGSLAHVDSLLKEILEFLGGGN